jgi:signal transduction histidine kinase
MSQRLIEAQEEERARIGRELHDDVNQRLALLAVELDRLDYTGSTKNIQQQIQQSKVRITEIATDVQALSHQLHSAKLDYLGLVAAARSLCKEVSELQRVQVDFVHDGVPAFLPKEVSLAMFRVLQEALQNSVKHSHADHFEVQLLGHGGKLQLTVRDYGTGFEVDKAMYGRGLGLISMRERVSALKGTIAIRSKPCRGTEVVACVPISVDEPRSEAISGAA